MNWHRLRCWAEGGHDWHVYTTPDPTQPRKVRIANLRRRRCLGCGITKDLPFTTDSS